MAARGATGLSQWGNHPNFITPPMNYFHTNFVAFMPICPIISHIRATNRVIAEAVYFVGCISYRTFYWKPSYFLASLS